MVSLNTLGCKIDFVGDCVAESTAYFFVIIPNFILRPIIEKIFFHFLTNISYQAYSSLEFQGLSRSEYGKIKLNSLHKDTASVGVKVSN